MLKYLPLAFVAAKCDTVIHVGAPNGTTVEYQINTGEIDLLINLLFKYVLAIPCRNKLQICRSKF